MRRKTQPTVKRVKINRMKNEVLYELIKGLQNAHSSSKIFLHACCQLKNRKAQLGELAEEHQNKRIFSILETV